MFVTKSRCGEIFFTSYPIFRSRGKRKCKNETNLELIYCVRIVVHSIILWKDWKTRMRFEAVIITFLISSDISDI